MRRNYLHLWLLLAAAFIAAALHSQINREPQTLPVAVRQNHTTARPVAKADVVAPDTLPKTILFIGDSMLEGLYPRLAAYANHNGHTLYAVIWYSSTSEIWSQSGKLKSYIRRLNPDYIFICLGSNELFVKNIDSKRSRHVQNIIDEIGDIPYLWIGPPNWRPDTGINGIISQKAAPGSFFLSDGMAFERKPDGAHPTRNSAARWMDSVVRWMTANSSHPIKLDKPPHDFDRAHRVFIHKPDER